MGTQASEVSGQVSVDDFKTLESSMTSQISELHEMIVQLMQAKTLIAPPIPKKPATPQVENEGLEEEVADKGTEAKSSTKGDKKGEFPHWYSLVE
jgi:chromatin remodeling complex protein RSC6